jgi:predicted DNA-binding ribbon-helix-helix protein
MSKLNRYVKNKRGDKVRCHVTSVNLEGVHIEFLKRLNLNLSLIVRDILDKMIRQHKEDTDPL